MTRRHGTASTPNHDRVPLDGIINLNKPAGITSAKALYRVRKIVGQKKSGHAGTLDPGATGVLVICLGRATKLVESIMDHPKVYLAGARFDVTSKTLDSDSPIAAVSVASIPTREDVEAARRMFEGTIQQVPPIVSAVKVRGIRAYKLARRGETPVLRPRVARIDWIHIHHYDWPNIEFEMCCGRGTYVRSLIRDWGGRLGVGGCLTWLVRTRVGPFDVADACSFESLDASGRTDAHVVPLDRAKELVSPEAVSIPPRPVPRTAAT